MCSRGATSIARRTTTAIRSAPDRIASLEWKAGEYILLERVPHYWRGDEFPKIRRLLFKFVAEHEHAHQPAEERARCTSSRSCRGTSTASIAALPAIVVQKTPGNAYEHVTLNERQFPPFADVRVRRALIYALDRAALHADDSRRPRAGGARADPADLVGVHRRGRALPIRPGTAHAHCSTRRAGSAARTASAERTAQRARASR